MTRKLSPFSVRMPRAQRLMTHLVLALVATSGLAWWVIHDWLQNGWLTAEHRLLVLHGTAAAFSLVAFGALMPAHMRIALRTGHHRVSGLSALGLMCLLALSGLLLYYGSEEWRTPSRWLHVAVGAVAFAVVPLHIWFGYRRRVKPQQSTVPSTKP